MSDPCSAFAGHFGLREFESLSDWRVQPAFVKLLRYVGVPLTLGQRDLFAADELLQIPVAQHDIGRGAPAILSAISLPG